MILPEGPYYIGDPAKIFTRLTMKELLKGVDAGGIDPIKELQDCNVWLHQTGGGPGAFSDQNGMRYQTFSGLLVVSPTEVVEIPEGMDSGTVIQFDSSFVVSYKDGFFHVGHVVINTSVSAEEAEKQTFHFDGGYSGDLSKDIL